MMSGHPGFRAAMTARFLPPETSARQAEAVLPWIDSFTGATDYSYKSSLRLQTFGKMQQQQKNSVHHHDWKICSLRQNRHNIRTTVQLGVQCG
jgi:hypothetical protein